MKILVAVDSSGFADNILNEIAGRNWDPGTEIRLVTSIETTGHWDADDQYLHQCRVILNERAKTLLKKLRKGVKVIGEAVEGSASSTINRTAEEWGADLIIIGSHGDTGVRKAGLGSVAAAVVNEAPCSVEVVKLHKNQQSKGRPTVSAQVRN